MKNIAIVGDTHADEHSRFDEHNRIMGWIAQDAAARECSLMLHSGDVWERGSTVRERLAVADYVRAVAEHMAFAVVGGNHDNFGDIEWIGRLSGRHPILSLTRPDVIELAGCRIACLPWPRKATLLAALNVTVRDAGDQAAVQALRDVLRGLGLALEGFDGPRLFLGHCMLRGSRTTISQPPLTGCDLELGLEDLAMVRAAFYALGHIHLGAGNEWLIGEDPAAFPGSPRRCNYGEVEPKGYIVAKFEGARLVGWERIETPCTPMLHVSAAWEGDRLLVEDGACSVVGAEIRLRFTTPHDQQTAARAAAGELRDKLLSLGAASVKEEAVVITEQRARAPELTRAQTLDEKLAALWGAKGFDPGERCVPLLDKVRALEEASNVA